MVVIMSESTDAVYLIGNSVKNSLFVGSSKCQQMLQIKKRHTLEFYHFMCAIFVFQKLKQLESELSKALDLAQGYKEKVDSVEKERQELIEQHDSEIKGMMDRIQEEEQKLDKANQLNFQLIQEKEDTVAKVKEAEQEAQKVSTKYEGCIIYSVGVTQVFVISHPVPFTRLWQFQYYRIQYEDGVK
jgi:DNA repair exonuclease SbcCD ATPase subunit